MEQSNKEKKRESRQRMLLFLVAMLCLLAWVISEGGPVKQHDCSKELAEFERTLHNKEHFLKEVISELELEFENDQAIDVLNRKSSRYQDLSPGRGISLFYFEKGELAYWSDHAIPLRGRWNPRMGKPFLSLRNADYVTMMSQTDQGILLGLIEIKTHYPFQNEFLINGFQKDFLLIIRKGFLTFTFSPFRSMPASLSPMYLKSVLMTVIPSASTSFRTVSL